MESPISRAQERLSKAVRRGNRAGAVHTVSVQCLWLTGTPFLEILISTTGLNPVEGSAATPNVSSHNTRDNITQQ